MKRRNLEQIDVNVELPFSDRRQQDCLHIKSERRKVRKVIVERKRRERIDRSLDQLKQFLIDHSSSNSPNHPLQVGDPCGPSNLEKADILELTVDHLRLLRTRTDQQRALGYNRCAREVDQFLRASCPEGEMRRRLMAFLARRQPPQPISHTALFGRVQGPCSWSAEMSTSLDEQRLGTGLGIETTVTDSRTEFSVIRHPSLVNHIRQPSPFNRVLQPSPINHVQSAVVDTTINEERRVESEEEDFAEVDDDQRQSSVTKSAIRMTASPESSICSLSVAHDFSKSSVRLGERDRTDGAVKGSNDQDSVWRPW